MNYYNIHYTGDEINELLGKINMENYLEVIKDSHVIYEDIFKLLTNPAVENSVYKYINHDFTADLLLKDQTQIPCNMLQESLLNILNKGRELASANNVEIEAVCFAINNQVFFAFNVGPQGFNVVIKDMKKILNINGDFNNVVFNIDEIATVKNVKELIKDVDVNIDLEKYATKDFVNQKIAEAELGGDGGNVDLSGFVSEDELQAALLNKVDKIEGKSLIDDSELIRLSRVHNYDDTELRDLITKSDFHKHENKYLLDLITGERIEEWNNKVDREPGKSLISDSEIERLADLRNYDDSFLRELVSEKANQVDMHFHDNKEALNKITDEKIAEWDAKAGAGFSGSYNDLTDKPEIPSVEGLASEEFVVNKIAEAQLDGGEVDLSGYATKAELALKANIADIPSIEGLASEEFVKSEIAAIEIPEVDLSNCATKEELALKADRNEIPSVEGLASEEFVVNKIAEAQLDGGEVDLSGYATKEDLDNKVDKVEGKSLVDDAEIARLANVDNYDDTELREMFIVDEPYMTTYNNRPYVFACGRSIVVEGINDEVVITFAKNDTNPSVGEFRLSAADAANATIVGGFGNENINKTRMLPATHIHVKNANLLAVHGGCLHNGIVGETNVIIENSTVREIVGGGDAGKSINGYPSKNVVTKANVKLTDVKSTLVFAGGSGGPSNIADCHLELNGNCNIEYLTVGGSNGFVSKGEVIINGGEYECVQTTNRGLINNAKIVMNGGHINRAYFGGESEDQTVTGIVKNVVFELNAGKIEKLAKGNSDLIELDVNAISGHIMNCEVVNGDVSMLEVKVEEADPVIDLTGYATEEFVNQQIAAIEHPQVDISGKVDKVENKSLVDDTEIARLAGVFNANYQFKINMIAAGEAASVSMQGDYPNITVVFNIPAGSVVEGGGEGEEEEPGTPKMWYGWIPYDESGVAGFSEIDHINENMTYDIMKFGIDNGTLIEAEPGVLGATEFLVGANGFLCTILPLDSNLVGLIDDGIGNTGTFSDFDTVSGLSLDDRTLVNKINGVTYKLSGMYDTNGGARYTIYVQEK